LQFGYQLQHGIPAVAAENSGQQRCRARQNCFDHCGIRFDSSQTHGALQLGIGRVGCTDRDADIRQHRQRLLCQGEFERRELAEILGDATRHPRQRCGNVLQARRRPSIRADLRRLARVQLRFDQRRQRRSTLVR
jgi:hypothetical protein